MKAYTSYKGNKLLRPCNYFTAVLVLTLGFSACTHSPSKFTGHAQPQTPLTRQWQADTSGLSLGVSKGHNPWGVALNDEVSALLTQATATNLNLQVDRLRVQQALTDSRASQGLRWPNLNLNGSYRASENRRNDGSTTINENASFGLSSRWELDLWGQLASTAKADKTDLKARQYQLQAARYSLQSRVLLAYINLLEQAYLKRLTRDNVALQEQRLEVLYLRLDAGLASSVDVRNTAQNLLRLQANEKDLQLRRDRIFRQLQVLLGQAPVLSEFNSSQFPALLNFSEQRLAPSIILNRPDLQQLEANVLAQGYRWQAAERRKLPRLILNLSSEGRNGANNNLFAVDEWLNSVSAALTQPLLNRASIVNSAKRAKLNQDIAWANYQQALLNAWEDIENGIQAESVLYQQAQLLEQSVAQGRAAETQTEELYFQGLATSFELLAAQRDRINSETAYIRSQAARLRNRIQLALALGLPAQAATAATTSNATQVAATDPNSHD